MRRIALICSGLEDGKDGVGDYCRRMSRELAALGVECFLLALNDRLTAKESAADEVDGRVALVRLPEQMSISRRLTRASALLSDWRPDWTSLQLVSYGFNRKGLLHRELFWLPRLLAGRKLHLMLHELWTGLGPDAPRKHVRLGVVQRALLLTLIKLLRPAIVQTSNPFFQRALKVHGVEAGISPLFANIPVSAEAAGAWLDDAIRRNGGPDLSRDRQAYWLVGIFGGIFQHWPAEPTLVHLRAISQSANRRLVVISAGHAGPAAESMLERWRQEVPGVEFLTIGPRSPLEISQFINSMDFGLTSYPYYALGKSGSVATVLEHGLPLIVGWGKLSPESSALDAELQHLVWYDDAQLEGRMIRPQTRIRLPGRCTAIAKAFASQLCRISDQPEGRQP
jgi:hypothetical protein